MGVQFRNLCFEGGGVKGVAYIGAMRVLQTRGVLSNIQRVGGTSAGAINALVYALGYTLEEQKEIISSIDFAKFKDRSWIVGDIRRVFSKFGLYKGKFFENWIGGLIEEKLGNRHATFLDLKKAGLPDLYVYGTNLNTGFSEVFSHERHPNMPLMHAVRISMSIPLFFTSVKQGEYGDIYVDGGVMSNYPVKLFDRRKYIAPDESYAARPTDYYEEENAAFLARHPDSSPYVYNRQTLGIRLDSDKEVAQFRYGADPKRKSVDGLYNYAKALVGALMQVQENLHLHSDDWHRTIYVNTKDVGAIDFDLTESKKAMLLAEGEEGANAYFEWFDNPSSTPRPYNKISV